MNNKNIAKQLGREGGKTTLKKYGSEHYRNIQKIGVENRNKRKTAKLQAQTGVLTSGSK